MGTRAIVLPSTWTPLILNQLWIQERLPLATTKDYGTSLHSVQHQAKANQVGLEGERLLWVEPSIPGRLGPPQKASEEALMASSSWILPLAPLEAAAGAGKPASPRR